MKKYIITAVLLLALAVGSLTFVHFRTNAMSDNVTVKETLLEGDQSYAEGIKFSNTLTWENMLFWDITCKAGSDAEITTDFRLDTKENEPEQQDIGIDLNHYTHGGSLEPGEWKHMDRFDPDWKIIKDVASRAKPSGEYREVVKMKKYYDYLPVEFHVTYKDYQIDISGNAQETFKIPVPDDYEFEVVVRTDEKGNILDYQCIDFDPLTANGVVTEKGCYLAVSDLNYFTDYNEMKSKRVNLPGIEGIYYIPFTPVQNEEKWLTADLADTKLLYPMDEKMQLVGLHESEDKKDLLLTAMENHRIYLSVIDKSSMKLKQKIYLCEGEDYYDEDIWTNVYIAEDSNVFMLFNHAKFALLSCKDNSYRVELVDRLTMDEAMHPFAYTEKLSIDYDGEKLAVVTSVSDYNDYMQYVDEFITYLSVFNKEKGLLYRGSYEFSVAGSGKCNDVSDISMQDTLKVNL